MKISRVYVSYGKDVMENFVDRMTGRRGEQDLRRRVRERLVEWATDRYGADTKVTWSSKLGCACGCSPGFSVSSPHWHSDAIAGRYTGDRRRRHLKEFHAEFDGDQLVVT